MCIKEHEQEGFDADDWDYDQKRDGLNMPDPIPTTKPNNEPDFNCEKTIIK